MSEQNFTPRTERNKQPAVGETVHLMMFQPSGVCGHGRICAAAAKIENVYTGTRADLVWEDPGNPLEAGHPDKSFHLTNVVRDDTGRTVGTWHPVKIAAGDVCHVCGRSIALDAEPAPIKLAKLKPVKAGDTVHVVRHKGHGQSPARFEKSHVEARVEKVHAGGNHVDLAIGDGEGAERLTMSPRDESGETPDTWHFPEPAQSQPPKPEKAQSPKPAA